MCGRFSLSAPPAELANSFGIDHVPEFSPSYNIAPMQSTPVIRLDNGNQPQCEIMRWGLVPHWAKDEKIGAHTINARIETADSKPAFRDAWKKRRCVVPATGFYEWKEMGSGKQPYLIHCRNGKPFGIAGLWEYWESPNGILHSFTIMTTEADDFMKPIHNRMPIILPADQIDGWLLFKQGWQINNRSLDIETYPVSSYVNNPKNNAPQCQAKVSI